MYTTRRHLVPSTTKSKHRNYNYCIYQTKENNDKGEGYYYTVISYMYFDTPFISIKIPIRGQTKTIYNYEGR